MKRRKKKLYCKFCFLPSVKIVCEVLLGKRDIKPKSRSYLTLVIFHFYLLPIIITNVSLYIDKRRLFLRQVKKVSFFFFFFLYFVFKWRVISTSGQSQLHLFTFYKSLYFFPVSLTYLNFSCCSMDHKPDILNSLICIISQ